MRKILLFSILIIALLGCKKEKSSKLQANGLTADINSLVPQSTIDKMKLMGMPINTGEKTPILDGIFNYTPVIIIGSSIAGETAGTQTEDIRFQFYQQDNTKMTTKVNISSASVSGNSITSYIVGSGKVFTVFSKLNVSSSDGPAVVVMVFSGTIESSTIQNLYTAVFMIENNGISSYIPNGSGRVFSDGDGVSEKVSSLKSSQINNINVLNNSAILKLIQR